MEELDPQVLTLERTLSGWLEPLVGERVLLTMARQPVKLDSLTAGEQSQWHQVGQSPKRQQSWRLGRAALKTLLPKLGLSADTSELSWPHPALSLTHCDEMALAVGVWVQGQESFRLQGIGVDVEPWDRSVSTGIVRHFLNKEELPVWHAVADTSEHPARDALRLWTVKEAVWKSCPENNQIPLNQVTLSDLAHNQGEARFPGLPQWRAQYCSVAWCGHWLSLAICQAN